MVRRKFNRAADAVKQFIESSWRGMHFRSKVGVYLTNVRLLSLRCNPFNATFSMFDIKHEHQCPTKTKKPWVHNHATKQPTTQRRSKFFHGNLMTKAEIYSSSSPLSHQLQALYLCPVLVGIGNSIIGRLGNCKFSDSPTSLVVSPQKMGVNSTQKG